MATSPWLRQRRRQHRPATSERLGGAFARVAAGRSSPPDDVASELNSAGVDEWSAPGACAVVDDECGYDGWPHGIHAFASTRSRVFVFTIVGREVGKDLPGVRCSEGCMGSRMMNVKCEGKDDQGVAKKILRRVFKNLVKMEQMRPPEPQRLRLAPAPPAPPARPPPVQMQGPRPKVMGCGSDRGRSARLILCARGNLSRRPFRGSCHPRPRRGHLRRHASMTVGAPTVSRAPTKGHAPSAASPTSSRSCSARRGSGSRRWRPPTSSGEFA